MSADLQPFVHYYCPCPDLFVSTRPPPETKPSDEDADLVPTPDLDINSSCTASSTYPLSRLYFCEDCHQIRCPRCVQDEVVLYYCPNCLFEVPTASVKSEKNRCARNCFRCPICQNTLSVVANTEGSSAVESTSGTNHQGQYYLSCGVCRWDSQEIGMMFEKPTSLALQLQKTEEALPDVREFDHLKDHFEKFLRLNQVAFNTSTMSIPAISSSLLTSLNASTAGRAGFSTFSTSIFSQSLSKSDELRLSDEPGPYTPVTKVKDEDMSVLDEILGIDDADKVSTLTQKMKSLHDQPYIVSKIHPQRIHLRIKRSKRCRTCRHILIKPEQKAQATKFKIKLVAMNYIPTLSLVKLPTTTLPLRINKPTQIVLKFTNPLYEEIEVSLATVSDDAVEGAAARGAVTLLSPQFTVGPYNETWEFDEEIGGVGGGKSPRGGRSKSRSRSRSPTTPLRDNGGHNFPGLGDKNKINPPGLWERKNNFTSVLCEVVPSKLGEFKFPLLVTYTYRSEDSDDKMDVDELDSVSPKSSEESESTKSYSFWCIIGLGTVVA